MANISFIDNNFKFVKAFIERDYSEIAEEISSDIYGLNFSFESDNKIYGYKISKNIPLTDLYKADFFTVRFYFVNIDTLHDSEQEKCMIKLLNHLISEMKIAKGYYNLRIPTNIVDLIRAYNQIGKPSIFCGGTVEQFIFKKSVDDNNKNGLHIFMADSDYISRHYQELLTMTYSSFETYQGQYHISHITSDKAGEIYKNWIENSLKSQSDERVIVAEYNDIPIGFVTIAQDEFAVEGVLSAVCNEYRRYGAYKAMISFIINYAYKNDKSFITSTQFDNFIVQGVWNSLGMKPFYSIYNFHIYEK